MKKLMILVLILVMALPVFAQDMSRYDDVTAESLDGVTVEFWHQHTRFRATQLEAMVAVFNNPDVTLDEFVAGLDAAELDDDDLMVLDGILEGLRDVAREYNPYGITVDASFQGGYGEIFDKINLGIAGGGDNLPDIVVAYQNQAAMYEVSDALVDMNALVASEAYGLSDDEVADFFEGFYNSDIFSSFDGARLGLAPNRSMEVMYYNADWLAELYEAGAISFEGAPQTPDQFYEAACAATENPFSGAATDADPIGYQLSIDASRFASWTFGFGGDIYDYDANAYTLDSDAAIAAMEFLQELFADGCAVEVAERFGDQTSFGAGNTLFTVGSSSGLPFYGLAVEGAYETSDLDGFNWDVTAIPHVTEEPVQNIYGASVSIVNATPEEEVAAFLFIKYYTSPVVQRYWVEASNYFPVRTSVQGELADYFERNPQYQSAFDLLQYGIAEPPVANYEFVRDEIAQAMAAIVSDIDTDVIEVLENTSTLANDNMAELMGE